MRKYILKLTPEKFFDKYFQNPDTFVCCMWVDEELKNILDYFFEEYNKSYTPFIKILYDEDYVFDTTDDLAYVIELHLSDKIVRITDLMLNNTLKELIGFLKNQCIA